MNEIHQGFVAFAGPRLLAQGARADVVRAMREADGPTLAFDIETGAEIDFDLRDAPAETPARGRPKLGVVAREVTLLPRHWDWLNAQRGGASAALRRLVDSARAADNGATEAAQAKAAAYRFLSAMAGDLPRFEEASRALFADDLATLRALVADWPADIVAVAMARLARGALSGPKSV